MPPTLNIAVIGAGPVGLALALHAARTLPGSRISLFDARPADADVSGDPRTLALSLGSVQLLQRLGAWPAAAAQPITEVHVSQAPPTLKFGAGAAEAAVWLRAVDEAVPMFGAVLAYGPLVAPLQAAWMALAAGQPERLSTRFGTAVTSVLPKNGAVEVDAGIAETFDLAVIAEGGIFTEQPRRSVGPLAGSPLRHDYRQTAWVGTVTVDGARPGLAVERFTRHGPLALLPLKPADGQARAALVWCVPADDDPVRELDDAQRLRVLESQLPDGVGRPVAISPLKAFPLGLNAERTLVDGATVRIGNAAQTLHPVAGQGLNLGLRDAFALVFALRDASDVRSALRRVEWSRAPDRWAMIAVTDFLARSFTWRWPGLPAARGLGLAALQALPPLKSALARQMMFGRR